MTTHILTAKPLSDDHEYISLRPNEAACLRIELTVKYLWLEGVR